MTEDEFERIKDAEKDRLRTQKRLRATLESLKRRNEVQSVVRRMSQGAKRLLEKTEALADQLASNAAHQAARLEVALETDKDDSTLSDAEDVLREERADALLRRMKAQEEPKASGQPSASSGQESSVSPDDGSESEEDGPDKTIGRMGDG